MTLRLIFIIGMASVAVSCGGSTKHAMPDAGAGTSAGGGSSPIPSAGSGGTFAGGNSAGGIASGGATSAPLAGSPDSGGTRSSAAGITATGGTATAGKQTTGGAGMGGTSTGGRVGGAGGTTTGGTSRLGGASTGGATTPVSSITGGATMGGKSTVGTAGAGGGVTSATATGGTSASDGATGGACAAGPPLTGGTQTCDQNGSGSYGSYTWRYWSNTKPGCLTTFSDGAFRVNWSFDSGDLWAGVGLAFDGSKTHQELGTFSADFAESKTGTAVTASYIGIYGYSEDALVEFFISDDAFQAPLKPWNSQLLGTLAVDGGIYDIYKTTGASRNGTFTTIHSLRQERRSCGHISISTHFSRWEELVKPLGKLQYVYVQVETFGGTGSVDFTTAKIEVN